jgi:hypothetical protein
LIRIEIDTTTFSRGFLDQGNACIQFPKFMMRARAVCYDLASSKRERIMWTEWGEQFLASLGPNSAVVGSDQAISNGHSSRPL